jgi:hypothetical protein
MPTIQDGKEAVEQGNLQQARLIFEAILQETPRNEEAWLGLAEVVTEDEDKRICYENVLKINKTSRAAKDGLRSLEPKENPFVTALQPAEPTPSEDDEFAGTPDETMVSARPSQTEAFTDIPEENSGSTVGLAALGLLLSIVVFACGGFAVYYVLSAVAGYN